MNLNKEIEELLKKYPDPRQKNKGVLEFARKLYYASCPPQTCGLLPEFCGQNSKMLNNIILSDVPGVNKK